MFRARRYRGLLAFAAIFVLAVIHFTSSRADTSTVSLDIPPPHVDQPDPVSPILPAADKQKEPAGSSPPPSQEVLPDSPVSQQSTDSNVSDSDSKPDASSPDQPAGESSPDTPERPQPSNESHKLKGGHLLFPGAHGQDALKVEPAPNPRPHWRKVPENFPIAPEDMIKLPAGRSKTLPKLQAKFRDETSTERMKRIDRLSTIRSAFEHAWSGYKASAMGHDELKPLRGGFRDTFNGWGATLVDTLDTLWIMDLKEEFSIAVDQVKKIDFTTTKSDQIPIFEVAIRYMGGLLGAYDISGHKYDILLEKATELGEILIGAFDTPNRMPILYYNWAPDYAAQQHHADGKAVLAELGSLSVELTRLAQLTKDSKYYDAIARITNELEQYQSKTSMPGLWPLHVDASGCRKNNNPPHPANRRVDVPTPVQKPDAGPTDAESYKNLFEDHQKRGLPDNAEPATYNNPVKESNPQPNNPVKESSHRANGKAMPPVTECTEGLTSPTSAIDKYGLGGQADSTYEYLPKEYMLLGGLNDQYRTMYESAMKAAREHIIYQPMIKDVRNIRFTATVGVPKPGLAGKVSHSYEATHLACFTGGMVGIGAKLFGIEGDMDLAAKLTDGCVWAYESTKTGIMPEHFLVVPCDNDGPCVWNETAYWRTLDPYAEKREHAALAAAGQKQEIARDSQDLTPGSEASASASASASATSVAGSHKHHGKRSPERGNWHVIASPTSKPKAKSADTDITDRDTKKLGLVSHEEFVSARIENERLFPGAVSIPRREYLLRPEAIESVFVMYRLTGNNYWREKGWKMFEAVAKYTRTELAHSTINDVTSEGPRAQDHMQSFWLAETLKYFYLLFSDPSVVNLDEYVLNSEAHPLKRPEY
ncbi:class I alpha-mannosidase 1A [Aspergillus steynii IBT 23096]|uniref:alpha-1,2-Mannosidase n=1 Tax=Aspergillus steynii IBT 23096 TaxID=1392250 RepID=A0A2I2GBM2_9EURO|nr:class I alpha-mannosidase 1A [Aspergillus steynii IBT 23096]PLB50237.1 class I alpha-mannosidase 1A [Aspergillus steynii IBT 23096]